MPGILLMYLFLKHKNNYTKSSFIYRIRYLLFSEELQLLILRIAAIQEREVQSTALKLRHLDLMAGIISQGWYLVDK